MHFRTFQEKLVFITKKRQRMSHHKCLVVFTAVPCILNTKQVALCMIWLPGDESAVDTQSFTNIILYTSNGIEVLTVQTMVRNWKTGRLHRLHTNKI